MQAAATTTASPPTELLAFEQGDDRQRAGDDRRDHPARGVHVVEQVEGVGDHHDPHHRDDGVDRVAEQAGLGAGGHRDRRRRHLDQEPDAGRTVRTSSTSPTIPTITPPAKIAAACAFHSGRAKEKATAPSAIATPPRYGVGVVCAFPAAGWSVIPLASAKRRANGINAATTTNVMHPANTMRVMDSLATAWIQGSELYGRAVRQDWVPRASRCSGVDLGTAPYHRFPDCCHSLWSRFPYAVPDVTRRQPVPPRPHALVPTGGEHWWIDTEASLDDPAGPVHGEPGAPRRGHHDSNCSETNGPSCRFCGAPLEHTFVDLGMSPLCESYVRRERAQRAWSRSIRCTSTSASSASSCSSRST